MLFEQQPALFVDLTRQPIVFTVRGISHFSPRFRYVGVDIADVTTAELFSQAYARWLDAEQALLLQRIEERRGAEGDALRAILDGDADSFEAHLRRLEHRQRACLKLVK